MTRVYLVNKNCLCSKLTKQRFFQNRAILVDHSVFIQLLVDDSLRVTNIVEHIKLKHKVSL